MYILRPLTMMESGGWESRSASSYCSATITSRAYKAIQPAPIVQRPSPPGRVVRKVLLHQVTESVFVVTPWSRVRWQILATWHQNYESNRRSFNWIFQGHNLCSVKTGLTCDDGCIGGHRAHSKRNYATDGVSVTAYRWIIVIDGRLSPGKKYSCNKVLPLEAPISSGGDLWMIQ